MGKIAWREECVLMVCERVFGLGRKEKTNWIVEGLERNAKVVFWVRWMLRFWL